MAEALAKQAVKKQPTQAPADAGMLETDLFDAKLIVKFAAGALRKWPPLDKKVAGVKMPGGRRRRLRTKEETHYWQFGEGAWKCTPCLRCAIGAAANPGDTRGKCTAIRTADKAREAQAQGHPVAIVESAGLPVIFCTKCGAWTARRQRATAKPCKGRATAPGRQALYNMSRGERPWLPPGTRDF